MEKALFAATEANVTVQGLLKKRAAGVSKTVPIKQIYVLSHIHPPSLYHHHHHHHRHRRLANGRGMCNMNFVF